MDERIERGLVELAARMDCTPDAMREAHRSVVASGLAGTLAALNNRPGDADDAALEYLGRIVDLERHMALSEQIRDVDLAALLRVEQTTPRKRRSFRDGLRRQWWER